MNRWSWQQPGARVRVTNGATRGDVGVIVKRSHRLRDRCWIVRLDAHAVERFVSPADLEPEDVS